MKLLILGGTVFLGRAVVAEAQARGHDVTIFTRGEHNPALFPEVEKLRGNRDGDLAALAGRRWDAAIDTSGYVPRVVRDSARLLAPAVAHYTFVSTLSVYAHFREPGLDEGAPIGTLADPGQEEVTGETYGPLKALCEQAAAGHFPGRLLVVRPGLLVGPHDPTDRFTYWPRRVAQGGKVLAPAPPEAPVQFVDARDLAAWVLRMVEQGAAGTFNATGPAQPLTLGDLLAACQALTSAGAALTWVPAAFLQEAGVQPWMELPLWIGDPEPDMAGFSAVSAARAQAAGLAFRPLAETIRDTLAWDQARPPDTPRRAGLDPARERELLAAWHASAR